MTPVYKQSLFIFRRDLRLEDNTGLINAINQSEKVILAFIFDPQQVGKKNKYYSANAVQFMIESLQDLESEINNKKGNLYLFYGKPEDIISTMIAQHKIDAIFVNKDYTPFSIERDNSIKKICLKYAIALHSSADVLLNEPEKIHKADGKPYSVFSAFYKKAQTVPVDNPKNIPHYNFFSTTIQNHQNHLIYEKVLTSYNKKSYIHGGTKKGAELLKKIKTHTNYSIDHDYPAVSTSCLSAHLKFGTISIRQAYYQIKKDLGSCHPLIRQLYWRDFFTHIAFHFPTVFGAPFHKKYQQLSWNSSTTMFTAWCLGKTGFPIVDAGMRQLNATGFMHNRVRMIVASFLTKDLHINWLRGENYFAQKLSDYDPSVNNGNWQWSASTGCDSQPYFRIFNPWLQQKKFDPECIYIKKWVPELKDHSSNTIHNLFKTNSPHIDKYPRPIVDHAQQVALTKTLYKQCNC